MRNYWRLFNENSEYTVGGGAQPYITVSNIEFNLMNDDLNAYFELSVRNSRENKIVVNLIVEGKASEFENVEELYNNLKAEFQKNNNILNWVDDNGRNTPNRKRLKAQLASIEMAELEDEVRDPKEVPNRIEHFNWYNKILDEATEVFDAYLN